MHCPGSFPKLPANFLFLASNPIPLLIKVLVHILRRNPAPTAGHRRRQPAVPGTRKHAAEPLNSLVVALKDDLRAVLVSLVVVLPILDRVGV